MMTVRRLAQLAAVVLASAATAGAAHAQSKADCSVETIDAVHQAQGPVYRDCDVERRASKGREPRLDFAFPQGVTCAMAELEFVIDSTGVPDTSMTIVVVDANNAEFVTFMRGKLGGYRFKPAVHEGRKVRQVYRLRVEQRAPVKQSFTVTEVRSSDGGVVGRAPMPPRAPAAVRAGCR